MDFNALLGGLGLGSILATAVQTYLSRRHASHEKRYSEKRRAYLGLLRALYANEVEGSSPKLFGHWLNRVSLFGDPEVFRYGQQMITTDPGTPERKEVFRQLLSAMRRDLGVDLRPIEQITVAA